MNDKSQPNQNRLNKSEDEIHLCARLLENSTDSIFLHDSDGRFIYVNKAAYETRGYTKAEFMGMRLSQLDTPEYARLIGPRMKQLAEKGAFIFESAHICKDGSVMPVEVHASTIKLSGQPCFLASIRDISARKRLKNALTVSELRYRRLFESARDGIIILNARTGQVVDVNNFMINLLGFSHKQFLGKKIWDIGFFKDIIPNKDNFVELQRQEYIRYENLPLETAAGRRIEVEFVSNVYIVGQEKVIQCNIRDITERKKIETQLFRAQKMESIGTLTGGIAHDFNNILSVIKGYTEMALMDIDSANPLLNNINQINQAVDRATGLTHQLLLFSRRDIAEITTVEPNQLIQNLLNMLNRLIGEHITIETKLATDVVAIRADAGNIEQLIMNLVVNARDAMLRGGKITIKTENALVDEQYCRLNLEACCGQFVCLSVIDTGTGMTDEVKSHMFEPFFTTKAAGQGTGLGLSVVYGIVKKHDGWVNIYSESGQGTIVRIYLPTATLTKEGLPGIVKPTLSLTDLRGNGERILLIEDDKQVQKVALTALTRMGYAVFAASTGAEAIELFNAQNGKFQLLLSDVVLPDGNGINLVEELRLLNPALKMIMTSGYPSKQSYQELIKKHKLPFIAKPYNLNNLFAKIKELLTNK